MRRSLGNIPDLTAGRDKYPASQQPVLREGLDRYISGGGVTEGVAGITIRSEFVLPDFFMVKVEKDGGVAGDDTETCTFTYTVTDMADVEIATEVELEQERIEKITYLEAGADGRSEYASAAFDGDDELILMYVPGEVPDPNTCPE